MKRRLIAVAAALVASSAAYAIPTVTDLPVYRTDAGPQMIVGSGIPKDNFTVSTAGMVGMVGGESVAIKARNRDTGQPLSISGNQYFVRAGTSSIVNPGQPQLAFDFQFSPGLTGLPATSYVLKLEVDFDPGVGTNYRTITAPLSLVGANNSWDDGDGFFNNNTCGNGAAPTACTWSRSDPFVYSQAWQLGFAFWNDASLGGPTNYNPSSPGVYDLRLTAFRPTSSTSLGDPIAFAGIQAVVVPEPSSLALVGIAALGLGALRRRR